MKTNVTASDANARRWELSKKGMGASIAEPSENSIARHSASHFCCYTNTSQYLYVESPTLPTRGKLARETETSVGSALTVAHQSRERPAMRWFRKMLSRVRFPFPPATFA